MGKKTKKTTWRNLPIEDQLQHQQCSSSVSAISDSEESHITINSTRSATTYHRQHKYYQGAPLTRTNQPHHQRYQPFRSTCTTYDPAAQLETTRYHNNGYASDHGYERKRAAEGSRYRNGGTQGESGGGKITFNEDEYTRITTPRQDVLFKKGYLNRPRPSSLAATACTTDEAAAVQDVHQLVTPEPVLMSPDGHGFCYPAAGGYIARDGLYFFNGFEPYPVVVYNAAPPQYCYEFPPSLRSKRYSTDSMTESTSPHTEEHSGADGEVPLFMPSPPQSSAIVQTSNCLVGIHRNPSSEPNTNSQEQLNDSNNPMEQRKLKKKRRRKLSKPLNNPNPAESTTTSVSVSSCEDDDLTSSTDTEEAQEIVTAKVSEDSPSTCPNSPQSGSSSSSSSSSSMTTTHSNSSITSKASSQLKPDAKEFIPRHYAMTTDFIPQAQFHVIDQHGFIHQPPFMPLPILLSPAVGPQSHHFMLPPPPYNAALNHLPSSTGDQQFQHEEQIQIEEEIQEAIVVEIPANTIENTSTFHETQTEIAIVKDTPKSYQVVQATSSSNSKLQQQQQNNLSRDHIREIVSKLEETAKEQQDKVVKTLRNTKGGVNAHQFSPKRAGKSPIRSRNNYRSSTNRITGPIQTKAAYSPQNQRKPYSNLFKQPLVIQNSSAKPVQKVKATLTSVKTINTAKLVIQAANEASPLGCQHFQSTSTNQWISVSNRKKRRSNNVASIQQGDLPIMADLDASLDRGNSSNDYLDTKGHLILCKEVQVNIEQTDDGFEEYDVEKLVDVVTQEIKEVKVVELEKDSETSEELRELRVKEVHQIDVENAQVTKEVQNASKTSEIVGKDTEESREAKEEIFKNKATNKKPNNNSKNSKQIKRVMVTDNVPPTLVKETPVKKVVESPKKVVGPIKILEKEVGQRKKDSTSIEANTPTKSSKRSNKKKSIPAKAIIESSSPGGLSKDRKDDIASCSFDFLPSDSEDKTNIEVSQELDMLIQRGMYSSLEEKIRSFNITASNDGFFKTIKYYDPDTHVNSENASGNRDFNGILKDLKPALNSKLDFSLNRINIPKDMSQIMAKQTSGNNGYQDFLGLGPDLHEPDKDNTPTIGKQKDSREISPTSEVDFPITRAVKEWLSKTKEKTPEVELLKSPTSILRQFKSVEASEVAEIDDEVTLWTLSNQDSVESGPDLLDCWDTEEVASAELKSDKEECFVEVELEVPNGDGRAGQGNSKHNKDYGDDNDDVFEVYESRYGKNEDFVRIREEWEERSKAGNKSCNGGGGGGGGKHQNRNALPPTASLPYRAICCAIM